jgi:hypothetical protein
MKLWRSMLAMLLCSGLIIAFGITACGGDDEANCAGALAQLQAPACKNAATTAIDEFRACMTACAGNEVCEDACNDDFNAATSACEPAATILTEECGCQVCGNNFEGCIAGQDPAADCVDDILDCFLTCVSS